MFIIDRFLINFSVLIVCLIPLALLTGPAIPDFFCTIVGIIFIFLSIKNKDFKFFNNNFVKIYFIFLVFLNFIALFSEYSLFSYQSTVVYFRFGIFALAVWFLLENNSKFIRYFFYALIITYAIALTDGYYQYIFDQGIFGTTPLNETRLTLTLNNKMILGGYLARLFPLLAALSFYLFIYDNKNSFFFILPIIIMGLTIILIYLTGERTAFAIIIIAFIMMILLIKKIRLILIISLISSLFFILYFTFSIQELKERNITLTMDQMNVESSTDNITYFSSKYENHILSGWKMFQDKPFSGHGPNMFRYVCTYDEYNVNLDACSTHPHNIYIQILSETGIFGFLLLLLPLYYVTSRLLIHFYNLMTNGKILTEFQTCILISLFLTLFPFLPTLNFFNNWINIIYYLPVGFYLYSYYSIPK